MAREDWVGLAFQGQRAFVSPLEGPSDTPKRQRTDQHTVHVGSTLEPSGCVETVPTRVVLDLAACSDFAEHSEPGLDAYAYAQLIHAPPIDGLQTVLTHDFDQAQPGNHCALGIVLVRNGCTEESENSVSGSAAHRSAEIFDRSTHPR